MNTHPDMQFSTIAELLFLETPALNFARLVSDLDAVLSRFRDVERQLTWDYEDIATFDMPGTRIVLATSDTPRLGVAISLSLSVGPSHLLPKLNAAPQRQDPPTRHAALCSKLVERVRSRLQPDAVLWHQCEGPVTSDMLDAIAIVTAAGSQRRAPDHPIFQTVEECDIEAIYAQGFQSGQSLQASNDQPHLPAPRDPELARLRDALYPVDEADAPYLVSPQMRLAAYSMNATLIMVALPVGAALMTYSVLRGDNMRTTSRALVATSLSTLLLQHPVAHQAIAIAGF